LIILRNWFLFGAKWLTLSIINCLGLNYINCDSNQLTELVLVDNLNLKELHCYNNFLTNLDLSQNAKLEVLNVDDDNFQSLDFLTHLINLRKLCLGNYNQARIQQGIYNRFIGSLEPLKNMNELEEVYISNTDLDSGVEYLPDGVKKIFCSADVRKDAKCQAIYNLFASDQEIVETEFPAKLQEYKEYKKIAKQKAREHLKEEFQA